MTLTALMGGDDEEAVTSTEECEGLDAFPFPHLVEGRSMSRAAHKYPRESFARTSRRQLRA